MPRRLAARLAGHGLIALGLVAPLAFAGALAAPTVAFAGGGGPAVVPAEHSTAGTTAAGAGIPAEASTAGEAPVSWSVSPADANGPDGRARVELELDPGETATEHLSVRNLGEQEVVFALAAADGYFTRTGRFNMLASDEPSVDAGTWIAIDDTVTVPAGGTVVVPFTVVVPADATPGDHAAGVAASITSVSTGEGAKLGVESRVGFRVMTRVTGEIQPGLAVEGGGGYRISWNPFSPGALEVSAELENTGNVRLAVEPTLESGGVQISPDGVEEGQAVELLPGDRRSVRFAVPAVWPLGAIGLPLHVAATTIEPDGASSPITPVEQQVTIWALPLPQLAVLLAVALILVGIVVGRRRRHDRVERMLAEAREAGRREALAAARTE